VVESGSSEKGIRNLIHDQYLEHGSDFRSAISHGWETLEPDRFLPLGTRGDHADGNFQIIG